MTEVIEQQPRIATSVAEYSPTEFALADLRRRTKDVLFEVTTAKGMDDARKARAEIRGYRVDLEAKRVELKAPLLSRERLLDAEAKRITAALVELEDPIDAQIKAEEKRKDEEKAAKARAEQARIDGINRQLEAIRQMPLSALGKTVGGIQADLIAAQDIDVEAFPAEHRDQAQKLVDQAVGQLTAMRGQRRDQDREAKRLADERAELASLRKAEDARIEAENAAAEAARADAQRAADAERAEQDRVAREERERLDAAARAENERVAEANRVEATRIECERQQIQREQEEARRAANERAIADATLISAATDAHAFLVEIGRGRDIVTLKLAAALEREGVTA